MTRRAVLFIEAAALMCAAYFGYRWLTDVAGNYEPSFALSLLVLAVSEWVRRNWKSGIDPAELAKFVKSGQNLNERASEVPLPMDAHDEWVKSIEVFLRNRNRSDYIVRLNDFSGMVFHGDGSQRSKFRNSIEGRLRRLHEFMAENARGQ